MVNITDFGTNIFCTPEPYVLIESTEMGCNINGVKSAGQYAMENEAIDE